MSKAQRFPTAIQDITLNLIFAVMGERRFNRMHDEYMAIAARLPPLKKLTFQINRLLQQLHKCNDECGYPTGVVSFQGRRSEDHL